MKKKLILLLLTIVLVSCSNSKEDPINPIVGLWKLKSITKSGQEFINACKSKDQVEIRSDKTFTILIHNEDSNCAEQSSTGSWISNSSNRYSFTAAGDTRIFTLVSDENLSFNFELNGGTVTYTYKKN
jgi:hypothetical protein